MFKPWIFINLIILIYHDLYEVYALNLINILPLHKM